MKILDKITIVEKFLKKVKQSDLSREYGTSRQRISQILIEALGKEGLERIYRERREEDAKEILALMKETPEITLHQMSNATGMGVGYIRSVLKEYKVQRDKQLIFSESKIKGLQNGRVRLTKDFLEEEYLNKDKTAKEISQETGYDKRTINKYIQQFRLLKRPYASNVKENNDNQSFGEIGHGN